MIEVEHLTKQFGPIQAVNDISFSVGKGEILGFLGPNGAGKTTTMRMLTGIFPPTSGTAKLAGINIVEKPLEIHRCIGYLPEQFPLYPELTVTEYLEFVTSVWSYSRSEAEERINNVLESCGLQEVKDRLLGRISRGYRQRVGLAQALVHDPEILILDEPTVGLDPKQIREIRGLIKSFAGKKTVILSTHILPEVSMTCQKVVIISQGKVVAQGTPESLTQQSTPVTQVEVEVAGSSEEVAKILSLIPEAQKVELVRKEEKKENRYLIHVLSNQDVRPKIARTIVENNFGLLEMHLRSITLEDIFVKLVTKEDAV